MTDSNVSGDHKHSDARDHTAATYRCVCGETVSLHSGSCSSCGRQYDADVLRAATAETTALGADEETPKDHLPGEARGKKEEIADQRLGHFRILSPIGRGGMGTVYRALDESLQRYVALKVLHNATLAGNDTDLQRIFQEARAQARVNHPNVAHIYYVGSEKDTPYLAMELVGHRTLADLLKGGPLPFHLIVRYAIQIAKALEAAGKFDIVHGDVKPANVLMVDDQTVKLSDFGLASRLSESGKASNRAAGTPDYMPPEATQGGQIDHRGDMYSLGVALFEMSFGRLPYAAAGIDVHQRLRLHREATVDFPDPWPTELPQDWRVLLVALLEKDPKKRYVDFAALIADLQRLEPTLLPSASPLLRGFAWLFDGFLVSLPLTIIALISAVNPFTVFSFLGTASAAAVTLGICVLQAGWGTTPGKRLFQIRIVDQHGHLPPRAILSARAMFQFAWAWSLVVNDFLAHLSLVTLGLLVNGLVVLFLLAEMLFVLFRKGRSIHDRILRTRVVLDAAIKRSE